MLARCFLFCSVGFCHRTESDLFLFLLILGLRARAIHFIVVTPLPFCRLLTCGKLENAYICETLCTRWQHSPKSYFYHKGQSQGYKVIDFGVIWKDIISRVHVYMPNTKSLSFIVQKLQRRLKVDNRQTNRQTEQKQYAFGSNDRKIAFLSMNISVNVTKALTLVSFVIVS